MTAIYLRTEEIPLDQLEHFPGNSRRGNLTEIRKSVIANGLYRGIVVRELRDADGSERLVILAGNHTFDAVTDLARKPPSLAAVLAGIPEDERETYREGAEALLEMVKRRAIRAEIVRCGDRTARKINIVDNRLNDLATDDADLQVENLSYLDGDYEGTGFTEKDVEKMLTPPEPPPPAGATFEVVVECASEADQEALYRQLVAEGRTCRVL